MNELSVPKGNSVLNGTVRIGEFFSGPGGMALGAEQACLENGIENVEHSWAVEYDQNACDTYSRNILREPGKLKARDVTSLSVKEMNDLAPVDLFLFGFPCNDFSTAGLAEGIEGKFGSLYRRGIDYLEIAQPKAFVAENVSGMLYTKRGSKISPFERIVVQMEHAGYVVYPHLYKLEEYGVPQTRHRVMLVGIRNDLAQGIAGFLVPPPSTPHLSQQTSVSKALEGLVPGPGFHNNELTKQSETVIGRLAHMSPGENIWEAMEREDFPDEFRIKKSGACLSQIYRKLLPDQPSYTMTGSGGGGTYGYHWKEPRALTNRERARIQTFPDDFVFCGGRGQVRRQIGMAVPPEAGRIVISALVKALKGEIVEGGIPANLSSHAAIRKIAEEESGEIKVDDLFTFADEQDMAA